ncbi:hypothetical protein MIS46_09965 [Wielerella bovis]|uniref:hypothetical protein n=1 Tax=Wielerella bovis TaxID=2917790 RepID=UPI002019643D|nr:hypothetical protein [Wielerella bovis]ULJ62272.1 hypothetical protein MIS46_09965 [Wielerella bovis]
MVINFTRVFNSIIMILSTLLSIYLAILDGFVGNGIIAILSLILLICIFLDFCLNNILRYRIAINLLILVVFSIFTGFIKNSKINDEIVSLSGKNFEEIKRVNLKYVYIIDSDICTYLVYKEYNILKVLLMDDNKTKICIAKKM